MRKFFVLIAMLALGGCGSSGESAQQIIAFTPEHFRDTALITDDALETTAIITTEQGRHEARDMAGDGWTCKSFLRAFVDKRSGAARYQLYIEIFYFGDRRVYSTINYSTPEGVQSSPLVKITHDRDYCRKGEDCPRNEDVGFDMPENMVRQLAAAYAPNTANGWLFRVKGKFIGTDVVGVLMPSEASGLLMAVKAYKASLHR